MRKNCEECIAFEEMLDSSLDALITPLEALSSIISENQLQQS